MRTLYLLLIVATNLITAKYNPISLFDGVLIIPVGSLFAGGVFVLRDLVQMKHGKEKTYTLILLATILSSAMTILNGDVAYIATASAVAFFVSESVDTEIFSHVRRSFAARVLLSGIVGGVLDSAIFVIVGLSPLGANMLPWALVPFAVMGQVAAKTVVQFAAVMCLLILKKIKNKKEANT